MPPGVLRYKYTEEWGGVTAQPARNAGITSRAMRSSMS